MFSHVQDDILWHDFVYDTCIYALITYKNARIYYRVGRGQDKMPGLANLMHMLTLLCRSPMLWQAPKWSSSERPGYITSSCGNPFARCPADNALDYNCSFSMRERCGKMPHGSAGVLPCWVHAGANTIETKDVISSTDLQLWVGTRTASAVLQKAQTYLTNRRLKSCLMFRQLSLSELWLCFYTEEEFRAAW